MRWFGLRRRGAFAALVQAGWFEAILAAVLAVVSVGLLVGMGRAWQGVALDLLICAVAAGTGRWPRVAAVALAVVMVAYLLIPRSWTTMGEYAPFIPILGSGMRGATRLRALMTIGYFPLSVGRIFALAAPDQASAIAGSLLWAVLIAILWLIGNAFTAVIEAQRKARAAELGLMRQELTRELHDTVARSLTRVTLAAERARLRGGASEDDLALISDTAADGIRQLRWVMSLLASPVEPGALSRLPGTSLNTALASAEAELSRLGFLVSVSVTGDPGSLRPEHSAALGAATGEAVANIIKHGDPDSLSAIAVTVTVHDAELVFINAPRPVAAVEPGSGMGLLAMEGRLQAVGGDVTTECSASQWRTRIHVPLQVASAASTPGG